MLGFPQKAKGRLGDGAGGCGLGSSGEAQQVAECLENPFGEKGKALGITPL